MKHDHGAAAGVSHVRAGDGPSRWVLGDTYTFKATAESTGGALTLLEASIPAGSGPPPHRHANEDEAFYLLAGALQLSAGTEIFVARAGDFVFIPRGTLHCFKNVGVDAAHALILLAPAGFERFFAEVGSPARPGEQPAPLTPDELNHIIELAPRYGARVDLPANLSTASAVPEKGGSP